MAKERGKPGPKPQDGGRVVLTNIRSTVAWRDWLRRFSEHKGADISDLIDEALLQHARREGFEMPPKR